MITEMCIMEYSKNILGVFQQMFEIDHDIRLIIILIECDIHHASCKRPQSMVSLTGDCYVKNILHQHAETRTG